MLKAKTRAWGLPKDVSDPEAERVRAMLLAVLDSSCDDHQGKLQALECALERFTGAIKDEQGFERLKIATQLLRELEAQQPPTSPDLLWWWPRRSTENQPERALSSPPM